MTWLTAEAGKGVNPVFHLSGQPSVTSLLVPQVMQIRSVACGIRAVYVCIAHAFTALCV